MLVRWPVGALRLGSRLRLAIRAAQPESHHLSQWTATSLWCLVPDERRVLVEDELADVLNVPARALEDVQGSAVLPMVENGLLPRDH